MLIDLELCDTKTLKELIKQHESIIEGWVNYLENLELSIELVNSIKCVINEHKNLLIQIINEVKKRENV